MMIRIACLLLMCFALAPAGAEAQAARSVLLRLCNDAPFDAGAAVAYQTGASESRTAQGWFLIPAGECLEGGLEGVAGGRVGVHVLSGEWRWPVYETGPAYCTPASGFRRPDVSGPPCGEFERPANFQPVAINPFRSGWGVVDFRFSCNDFPPADRELCGASPRGRDGMAMPVRELEVCNRDIVTGRYALGHDVEGGRFQVSGWRDIPAGHCETVYRGFPADNRVYVRLLAAEATGRDGRAAPFGERRSLCHAPSAHFDVTAPRPALVGAQSCPADAPELASFQEILFRENVARFTHTVHTLN